MLTGKRIVVTGGTGSLGKTPIRRLLSRELGQPEQYVERHQTRGILNCVRTVLDILSTVIKEHFLLW